MGKSSSYIKGYFRSDLKVTFPLSLIATFSFVVGLIIRQNLVGGKFTIISLEDVFFSLFLLLEYLILKKGLKSLLPSFNFKNGQNFLLGDWFSLKSAISAYLFNLTIAVLSIRLLFAFLIC